MMAQFKGAQRQKKAIASHLESLEALGVLLSSKEEGAICWYYAELQKAGRNGLSAPASFYKCLIIRQGFPPATTLEGISLTTTLPAAIVV